MKKLLYLAIPFLFSSCNSEKKPIQNSVITIEIIEENSNLEKNNQILFGDLQSPESRNEIKLLLRDIGAAKFGNTFETKNYFFKSIFYDKDSSLIQPCDAGDYAEFWFDIGNSENSTEEFGSMPYPILTYGESDQFSYFYVEETSVYGNKLGISVTLREFDYDRDEFYIDMATSTIIMEITKSTDGKKFFSFPYSERFEGGFMLVAERNSYPIMKCE